jgi:hypothetical protein
MLAADYLALTEREPKLNDPIEQARFDLCYI